MKLISYDVDNLRSFFDIYFLIIKNEAIFVKTFLFKLISNLTINKKSI